jgi:integrase
LTVARWREQIITQNPAAVVRLPSRSNPGCKIRPWTADEARQFLESARSESDGLYAAYVLLLVLGLRKGELLGLTWEMVSLDAAELYVGEQLQRVGRQLLRRPTKTEGSEAPLPLPDLCVTALKLRRQQQDTAREQAGGPGRGRATARLRQRPGRCRSGRRRRQAAWLRGWPGRTRPRAG